jgi:hypothetical protein
MEGLTMRRISLLALALMATTVAVAVPAQAANTKPTPSKCQPHAISYVVSGMLVSGTLTRDAGKAKTYSGTLTVHVTKTDNHAKADKNQTKTYTLSHANVSFGASVNKTSPAAGSRVTLKGTITTLAPKCNHTGFTPTIATTKVEILRAKTL